MFDFNDAERPAHAYSLLPDVAMPAMTPISVNILTAAVLARAVLPWISII